MSVKTHSVSISLSGESLVVDCPDVYAGNFLQFLTAVDPDYVDAVGPMRHKSRSVVEHTSILRDEIEKASFTVSTRKGVPTFGFGFVGNTVYDERGERSFRHPEYSKSKSEWGRVFGSSTVATV